MRYNDFSTITRSHTEAATRDEERITRRALELLQKTEAGRRPVRLLGVSVHNLTEGEDPVRRTVGDDRQGRLPFEAEAPGAS